LKVSQDPEMRVEPVEILSDATNAAVMRHPGRRFPGFRFQGDTLYSLCLRADDVCSSIGRGVAGYEEANDLRNRLWAALNHYKSVLDEHKLPLPFCERPVSP
jgi:hypothetical protein